MAKYRGKCGFGSALSRRQFGAGAVTALALTTTAHPLVQPAWADSGTKVYFAGHAFTARYADMPVSFPYVSSFLNEQRASELDGALTGAATPSAAQNLSIEARKLGTLSPGQDAFVLALAFDQEAIEFERIGNDWKLLVEIAFQALIFDFKTTKVVAGLPLVARFIDTLDHRPTTDDVQRALARLILGKQSTGVQASFWSAVKNLKIPKAGARSLRVTSVDVDPQTAESVEELSGSVEVQKSHLAHSFGKYLAANQNVSILPASSNHALGNKMAARFADGAVFDLQIPAPDYSIALRLDGLRKVVARTTATEDVYVYGAFITFTVTEPLSGRRYFDRQVKLGATKTIFKNSPSVRDWPAYAAVLEQLFDEFSSAISGPNVQWGLSHILPVEKDAASLASLKELIQLCR